MTDPDAPRPPGGRRIEKPKRKIWKRILLSTGILVLVLAVAAGAAYWKLQGNIDSTALTKSVVKKKTPQGALNILFLGSDSRKLKEKGYGNTSGQRSDAMMLVHIARENARIDAVQIPRDTMMQLPACEDTGSGSFGGGTGQVNSALNWGPACSVKAIEKLTNVRIDHFVQLDFDGFAGMVNAMDGVGVCLLEPIVDRDAKLNLPAGRQKLNGKKMLALARARHAIGDGSDIGRLGHQQIVMSSIINRARSAGVISRPDRLFKFLNALTSSITVDDGISSIPKLTGLAKRARAVPDKKITFITMPYAAYPADPNRVIASTAAPIVFKAIANDVPVPLQGVNDGLTRTSPVRIVNASRNANLAYTARLNLTKLGYKISETANADNSAVPTRIFIDSTPEAKKTAEALNKDFGLNAEIVVKEMTGVWLVIGSDRVSAGLKPVAGEPVKTTTRTAADELCS